MKIIPFILLFLFSCDCNREDEIINATLPICIEQITASQANSETLKTICAQNVNGDVHYWLNTDFTQSDGVEYMINNNCDTICTFCGECWPANCTKVYRDTWQIIWKK